MMHALASSPYNPHNVATQERSIGKPSLMNHDSTERKIIIIQSWRKRIVARDEERG